MQRELCARINEVLATMPIQDPYGYEALAKLKLPGMDYLQVLKALHMVIKPKLYVEIGVRTGDSLLLADASTRCIAIDPAPRLPEMRPNVEMNVTTSDKFFYHEDRAATANGFDLAFIDGDHSFEQAARDFANLEKLAGPNSIIAIHDVIPMDERTSTPEPETAFHTGNVWRLMASIVDRTDLVAFTIACPPTGLGIVGRFSPLSRDMTWLGAGPTFERAAQLPFPSDWNDAVRMLNIVDNDYRAWGRALQGQKAAA